MSFRGIAAAARRQGNRSLESLAISKAYGPKYDRQVKENMKNRAAIESAGQKADYTVKTAENRAELEQIKTDATIDAAKIRAEGKKAGMGGKAVQMAGKVAAAALMKTPDPIKPVLPDTSAMDDYFKKQSAQLAADRAKPVDSGKVGDPLPTYDPNKTYGAGGTGNNTGSNGTKMAGGVAAAGGSTSKYFDVNSLTDNDFNELAYIVSGEAAPGTKDEFGVAASVLNRVASGQFPNSIKAVGRQPKQYEAVTIGTARYDSDLAAKLKSNKGQLADALNTLQGRTDFKGQSMLKNRVAAEDPMFDPKGNFYHYAGQT